MGNIKSNYAVIEGQFVNNKVANIATALAEYEPELEVEHYPENEKSDNLPSYGIVHNSASMGRYVLFYVMKEEDMDERVIARVIANDQRKSQSTLSDLESWEKAQAMLKKQEYMDKMEEAADILRFGLKTHLNTYTVPDANGKIIKIRE
jgi:hypothetical protein